MPELEDITTYQAGTVQASMHRLLQKRSDELLKPFGITKMQWMIIGNVLDAGKKGIRISDLSNKLATTLPYMTTSLNLLQSKGIISKLRDPKDSRSKLIRLSPKFEKKCKTIEASLRQGLRESIYSEVDPAEFQVYIKVMYQLNDLREAKADKLRT